MNLIKLDKGLYYVKEIKQVIYTNEYIREHNEINKDWIYFSKNKTDNIYADLNDIKTELTNTFKINKDLIYEIDLEKEIEKLIKLNPNLKDKILEEYEYIKQNPLNIELLKIAFNVYKHFISTNQIVYMMRGSAIASVIFYALGLNYINPLKFNLDYKNFWKK